MTDKNYREVIQDEHDDTSSAKKVMLTDSSGNEVGTQANKLEVEASLETGDIQIGAVEIKNATDDTRAVVSSDGSNNALHVQGTDIDIRDLTSASDSVASVQSGTKASTLVRGKSAVAVSLQFTKQPASIMSA